MNIEREIPDWVKNEMAVAFAVGRTFEKTVLPILLSDIGDYPVPSYVYARAKREVHEASIGIRNNVFTHAGDVPPVWVLDLPLRDQIIYIWKYRSLLRKQKRLSFWVKYTGLPEKALQSYAEENEWQFEREIADIRDTRRKYTPNRAKRTASITYPGEKREYHWETVLDNLTGHASGDDLLPFGFVVGSGSGRATVTVMAVDLTHAECMLIDNYGRSVKVIRVLEAEHTMNIMKKNGVTIFPGEVRYAVEKVRRINRRGGSEDTSGRGVVGFDRGHAGGDRSGLTLTPGGEDSNREKKEGGQDILSSGEEEVEIL